MNFIIDQSKWISGENSEEPIGKGVSLLLNNEGYSCVIGQCALQMGIPQSQINGRGVPMKVDKFPEFDTEQLFVRRQRNTHFTNTCMSINDSSIYTLNQRKALLIKLFASKNHTLLFVNEPVKYELCSKK